MSNGLPLFSFDNSLDWVVKRFASRTTPFFTFTIQGSKEIYIVNLDKYFSKKGSFPKMIVKTQDDEVIYEKKIKAGLQYEINEDVAIYFQILNIDVNTVLDIRNYQNTILFGYTTL